jgi:ribosomal protein S13
MPIAKLLVSQPRWGDARARAFLAEVGVREDKSIGSLSERQSRAIASLLTRASGSGHGAAAPAVRDDKR